MRCDDYPQGRWPKLIFIRRSLLRTVVQGKQKQTPLEEKERDDELQKVQEQLATLMQAVESLSSANSSPEVQRIAASSPLAAAVASMPNPMYRAMPSMSPLAEEDFESDAQRYARAARQCASGLSAAAVPVARSHRVPPSARAAAVRPRAAGSEQLSSVASAGRINAEREDAVARLEGSHPDLVYRSDGEAFVGRRREQPKGPAVGMGLGKMLDPKLGRSAFSSDTTMQQNDHRPGHPYHARAEKKQEKTPRKVSKPLPILTPVSEIAAGRRRQLMT